MSSVRLPLLSTCSPVLGGAGGQQGCSAGQGTGAGGMGSTLECYARLLELLGVIDGTGWQWGLTVNPAGS